MLQVVLVKFNIKEGLDKKHFHGIYVLWILVIAYDAPTLQLKLRIRVQHVSCPILYDTLTIVINEVCNL